MKRPGMWEGVGLALVMATAASVIHWSLGMLWTEALAVRVLITLLTGAYAIYLLVRSSNPAGRWVAACAVALSITVLWLIRPADGLFLAGHLLTLWLLRSAFFQSGLITAALDLALWLAGTATAAWAAAQSHSLFLTFWCFFLVQAPFARIRIGPSAPGPAADFSFDQAAHAADQALRKLSSEWQRP
ncbi:MAG: hypothetical protein QNJ40_02135 [Xanthomonadales bacterium]|nr:hypothetical protein [Xanthomonadales bacterium]